MSSSNNKIPVAVLAATGTVGQRFVSLLAEHPWFKVVAVTASERSAGQRYADAASWVVPGEIPPGVADLVVRPTDADPGDVPLVFSALPGSVAREVELALAARGYAVCSNASALRMEPDVPLIVPEINPDHIHLIKAQREMRGWSGSIITAPNCAVTGFIFPLKVLHEAFGIEKVNVVTMQAISGAGYPGVSSFDILDNVIPFISGEEDKLETEPAKLLGKLADGKIDPAGFIISPQVNRVPLMDGHLAALSVKLAKDAGMDEVREAFGSFVAPEGVRDLPSTPERPVILRSEDDRPQPRRDRDAGNGMSVSVGRVRPCPVFDVKLVSLVHNTLRGAAGGAIQNAEWLVASGYLGEQTLERLHVGTLAR
ncbi:MAG: aspartate-semialdehyde dehydrogenase [Anaerolineae bacterium]|nr:aspartate-semialdehyde dehydrogenase [Anaerolineae bacterium]